MSRPFWTARSAIGRRVMHQALQVLRDGIMKRRGYWVLEVDIRKYFDSIPFAALRDCLAL
jgi:retron-type reverse transcriptase